MKRLECRVVEPVRRLCLAVGGAIAIVFAVQGEVLSPSLSVCADPDGDPRWNAVGNGCANLRLPWPDRALSASVVVSNLLTGTARTVVLATADDTVALDVPTTAKDETVYSLTATFSYESHKQETLSATCVAVRGLNAASFRFVAAEPETASWRAATKTVVLPTYASTDVVTRDGAELPAYGWWRGLTRLRVGDTQVTCGDRERTLSRYAGMIMIVR